MDIYIYLYTYMDNQSTTWKEPPHFAVYKQRFPASQPCSWAKWTQGRTGNAGCSANPCGSSCGIEDVENHRQTIGKPYENGGFMGFNGI